MADPNVLEMCKLRNVKKFGFFLGGGRTTGFKQKHLTIKMKWGKKATLWKPRGQGDIIGNKFKKIKCSHQ